MDMLKQYEDFQRRVFESANEPTAQENPYIPYGRCRRHPEQVISNGMFDSPCPKCEDENV